jgi:hypoxia up-regulated 1
LKVLLGKKLNDPVVKEYLSSLDLVPSPRGTVAFKHLSTTLELEQVVGMMLAHAKKQAEDYSGIKVKGAVITVPPNFNVFERRALVDAAEIGGLKVFGLINDETAGNCFGLRFRYTVMSLTY